MTLEQMQALATATLTASTVEERAAHGRALAQGFVDRFAEEQPCGWEAPEVDYDENENAIGIPEQWIDRLRDFISVDDADHMARMLLRAADAARAEEE